MSDMSFDPGTILPLIDPQVCHFWLITEGIDRIVDIVTQKVPPRLAEE